MSTTKPNEKSTPDCAKSGLFVQDKEINWVSKVIVAQKPPRLSAPSTHGRLMGIGS